MNKETKEKLDALKVENEQLKEQLKNSKTNEEFDKLFTIVTNLALTISAQEVSAIAFQSEEIRIIFFEAVEEIYKNRETLKRKLSPNSYEGVSKALNFKVVKQMIAERKPAAQA